MHSRISRLFRRTGGPAESSYAGFHFDEGTVIPETRIQKSPVTIPYSYIHPTTDFPASWGMRRGQWIRLAVRGKLAGDIYYPHIQLNPLLPSEFPPVELTPRLEAHSQRERDFRRAGEQEGALSGCIECALERLNGNPAGC